MSVSLDEVRHIAALARIGLDDARLATLAQELNTILGHIEVLRTADTTGIPDDDVAGRGRMPLSPDERPQTALASGRDSFAPAMRDGFFIVPRLATHEAEDES